MISFFLPFTIYKYIREKLNYLQQSVQASQSWILSTSLPELFANNNPLCCLAANNYPILGIYVGIDNTTSFIDVKCKTK